MDAGGRATHGAVAEDAYGKVRFHRIKAPTVDELGALVHRISQRVARFLERRGFLESDEDDCMDAGGTSTRMCEGRATQEQLPRATHGAVAEKSYLTLETSDDEAMQQLHGHSITYRIAIGPHQGRKVFA
jgi:hypothetical protein